MIHFGDKDKKINLLGSMILLNVLDGIESKRTMLPILCLPFQTTRGGLMSEVFLE
jgi:hypothetical protein